MPNPVPDDTFDVTGIGHSDQQWLRARLEELERIDRPSASAGELQAAEWLKARFEELGADARIETEPAHDNADKDAAMAARIMRRVKSRFMRVLSQNES